LRLPLLLAGPLLVLIVGSYLYLTGGRYVSTDDAYVQAARVSVTTQVAGQVSEVKVRDNQLVKKGDELFRLDDRPYRIAVDEAGAQLANAKLQITALKATYRQREADLQAAQDNLGYRQREFDRQNRLLTSGVATQVAYDLARHGLDDARQQVSSTQQQIASVLASLNGDPDIAPERHPTVQQAQALLDRAQLNLSYTLVRAPDDGIVTKVEQLQPGDYVTAGTPAFSLVSSRDVWIEANFKETDLTHMRDGQTASVDVDTYPDRSFHAHVVSLSPGTGSTFSLLPPENATGNWVKVVQRLPVRLAIDDADPARPLRAGMSADVEIDTAHTRPLLKRLYAFIGLEQTAAK
jgi:membrane fusion protein (multidrug efflux system)